MEEKDIMEQGLGEETTEPNAIDAIAADEPTEAPQEAPEEESKTLVDSDEEIEETANADAKPPKKKLSKGKIALICVASFILLVGIGIGLFFLIGGLLAREIVPKDVDFDNKAPAYAVTYTAAEQTLINNAMKDGASEDTVKEAIAMIYQKANYNKIHCEQAVAVLRGQGSAALEIMGQKPSGSMIVRGIKVQYGDEFYYQKGAPIISCSVPALKSILEDALNQQERAYTNLTDDFRLTGTLKGDKAKINTSGEVELEYIPFIDVDVPDAINLYQSKEKFFEKGYYLEDPREINNFLINKDTIVLKQLEEGQKYIEYDEEGEYYICRFSLLVEGEGHDECVQVARQYLRDSADSTDLEYGKFDVTLEVWKNGYLKKMHDEERWEGSVKIGGAKTSSETWYESIVYYDFDEKLFSEADAAEYEGEDWAKKIIDHYRAELDGISKKKTVK